ncbi:hypothetical protein FMUBM48_40380 [Nocardia cyriacigeorgica]|nr:hypothetical protein FMUBM48_40380 [Nocardia cyriacigeorgica]
MGPGAKPFRRGSRSEAAREGLPKGVRGRSRPGKVPEAKHPEKDSRKGSGGEALRAGFGGRTPKKHAKQKKGSRSP